MKYPVSGLPACLLLAVLAPVPLSAADADLAAKAQAVLRENCHRCHGRDGSAKGGFNYLLDRDQLVTRGKIVPGKAAESELFQRMEKGEMPPASQKVQPSPADLALLRRWIDAGAPAVPTANQPRVTLTSAYVKEWIRTDLKTVEPRHHRFLRYLSLAHLHNAGRPDEELETCRQAVSKLLNSLSWHPRITPPLPIDPARTILRIDLRSYQWNTRSWDRLAAVYPYRYGDERPGIDSPLLLRADWFVATASRTPFYYDLLALPSTDRELERQLRVDVPANIQDETALRAGFNDSGVSQNNRLIERHDAAHGAYWRSYDFSDNQGRQNLFERPLGPTPGSSSFIHAGGEVIFNLPNGLQGYLLVDANGRRVDRAPIEIVSDPRRPDRTVEAGLSCMTCHFRGIIPKSDQVRAHLAKNPQGFTAADAAAVRALYVPEARMKARMTEDSDRFVSALQKTGVSPDVPEPIAAAVERYEAALDHKLAAAELGLEPADLAARLRQAPALARVLGPLLVRGGSVQRQAFLAALPEVVREFRLADDPTYVARSTPANPARDPFRGHAGSVLSLEFSPDAQLALSAGDDRTVRLWEVASGRELHLFPGHNDIVTAVAFSPDGKRAVTGSKDRTLRVWDLEEKREVCRLTGHTDAITSVAFSPDGRRVLSGSQDRTLRLWDISRKEELRCFTAHTDKVTAVAISSDGRQVLSAGHDGVRHWDLDTGRELGRLEGHRREVFTVAFSPDGRQALTGGNDRTVRLWDLADRRELRRFEGHANAVIRVAFSADGRVALSGSSQYQTPDRTLRLWDVENGKELRSFGGGEDDRVGCVAFSRDGRLALVGSADNVLRLWHLTGKQKE